LVFIFDLVQFHFITSRSCVLKTILRSGSREVSIDPQGPFVIIGEKINPTGRKKMAAALHEGNLDYVAELAASQVAWGADILDVNAGVPDLDEAELLPQLVKVVTSVVDVPVCLDSANPQALAAALEVTPGKPLVNSVNGEVALLNSVLPIVRDRGAAVIGLTMDGSGIPSDPQARVVIAGKILERAAKVGIPAEDVVIDPLVMAVSADSNAGVVTLRTIEILRREFGVNINLGASNVSFGLPDRHVVNQAFLALAIGAGATCAITDPLKMTGFIRAVDLIHGRDEFAMCYIRFLRKVGSMPPS
jgi:5-methyltetrahydrofolate--homocysteine methyltransferase